MAKLIDLGFSKGTIFETIVSTYSNNKAPNAAPIGAIMQNPQTISLKIFNTSNTNRNLKANKSAVINLVDDIEVFYKTTFKEANPEGLLPQEWFVKAESVNAPQLRFANATIDVSVADAVQIGEDKTHFFCNVEQINVHEMFPQVYCRSMSATLEAIINATRVKVFLRDNEQKKQVSHLLELIENSNKIVNHTAPNSLYSRVMADLLKKIDSWRTQQ